MPATIQAPEVWRDLPDHTTVAKLEEISPGSGARLIEAYLQMLETEDLERQARIRIAVADASHDRVYRHLCLLLGTGLASGAIALGAYGISQGANLFSIAALVAPISGLAGVFVWGGRLRRETGDARGAPAPKLQP